MRQRKKEMNTFFQESADQNLLALCLRHISTKKSWSVYVPKEYGPFCACNFVPVKLSYDKSTVKGILAPGAASPAR